MDQSQKPCKQSLVNIITNISIQSTKTTGVSQPLYACQECGIHTTEIFRKCGECDNRIYVKINKAPRTIVAR